MRTLRHILTATLTAFLALTTHAPAKETAPAAPKTPAVAPADESLQKLQQGNDRYVAYRMSGVKHCDAYAREALAKTQKPFAIILSCSDSRVPPEIIFDQGLGELFVVRVAGNIPDPVILGSIEYAAEHLGAPLVLVLGHERCGAVTAAVDAMGEPEGNIGTIIRTIEPAVEAARTEKKDAPKAELVEAAIEENVQLVAQTLMAKSPILKELVEHGKLRVALGKYDLDTGKVTFLKSAPHKIETPADSEPIQQASHESHH